VEIRVEFDTAPIVAMCDALRAPGFQEVAALALNDTIKNGEVETAQLLRPLMGIPSADIKDALRTEPARPEHLEAALIGEGKAIPMIKFKVRDTRTTGVTLQLGAKTETYRRAFIATVKHGHRGVFERKGRERLPIRELYGPSVHGMMARSDVLPKIADYLNERLLVNLSRQIDRRIRRDAGKAGGA
jgi:hypothetical protein